jgi:putative nucleotidyltransferase with HDIG domain
MAREALESGETRVMQEYDPKCISADWAALAARYELRSSVALPLLHGGECYGVLCVHARQTGLFVDEELKLLTELANDLAFGIATVRLRTERDSARASMDLAFYQSIRAAALTVEKRDPTTAGHQLRVSELSVAIAQRLGLDAERVEAIRFAAMVHDIGNIYVPAEILNRPGSLSPVEFELVKCHVTVGHEIVSGIDFPWPVAEMVLQHHERLDGSGYPNQLRGEQIVQGARIIAVADVVEAICSHRPFRPALGPEAAMTELREGARRLYDPAVAEVCTALIQEGFVFG